MSGNAGGAGGPSDPCAVARVDAGVGGLAALQWSGAGLGLPEGEPLSWAPMCGQWA